MWDEYGIYVEDEIAVAFLGQEIDCRQNDPAYTDRFLGQFSEMIERDRSHPSVLIYSLANESIWGSNLELENRYAHEEDPSRLTIFSYPTAQKEDDDRADLCGVCIMLLGIRKRML
ncbi:MAG: glycoside hydrolase family 2 TIM barrel-domain containing protein [Lachnospiraceae bacterium]